MPKLFKTNVDSDFLQSFLAMKSNFDPEDSNQELDIWRSLFKFYKRKTNIHLFLKSHTLDNIVYELNSSLIKEMLDRYYGGAPDITISPFEKAKSAETAKSCNFVFENIDMNSMICKNHGIPHFIIEETIKKWEKYYSTSTLKIPSKKEIFKGGWKSIGIPKQDCNAMIICDNYLFQNKWNIDNTIEPMLDIFFPPLDLEIPFDLTIFSTILKPSPDKIKKAEPISQVELEKLHDCLMERFRVYLNLENINLTIIYKELRDYHDRHIFTNNFAFKSGNSFSYFGENNQPILPSGTTLDIIPLIVDNKDEIFAQTYKWFLNELNKLMQNSKLFVGSKQNRLFNQ